MGCGCAFQRLWPALQRLCLAVGTLFDTDQNTAAEARAVVHFLRSLTVETFCFSPVEMLGVFCSDNWARKYLLPLCAPGVIVWTHFCTFTLNSLVNCFTIHCITFFLSLFPIHIYPHNTRTDNYLKEIIYYNLKAY